MITQKNIVDRINLLTVDYNISWMDIMIDADRAITKINNFIGANYPAMSYVLDSPDRAYAFRSGEDEDGPVDTPYFADEHIYNVVIPFIAMEVLARDEEFTTIYNKYAAEVEDGLFAMFQKEFNRVPLAFRQNPDQGVFFASDSAAAIIRHNNQEDLPVFKFKVYYHVNMDDILFGATPFVSDVQGYLLNAEATVLGWNEEMLSVDNTKAYTFLGWTTDPKQVTDSKYAVGSKITMVTDIHLYAKWEVAEVLTNYIGEGLKIIDKYKPDLTNLVIPDVVSNRIVETISGDLLKHSTDNTKDATGLMSITLPNFVTKLEANAFNGFQGDEIIFPQTIVDNQTYIGITIEADAFIHTPMLSKILLPANVRTIESGAFPVVTLDTSIAYREIRCEILEQNKPSWDVEELTGWHDDWHDASNPGVGYELHVTWGYNG